MNNEAIVLGPIPEHALAGRLQFVEDSTREQRESADYYEGRYGAEELAEHAKFEEVRDEWLAQVERDREERNMYREGYYGA